MRRGIPGVSQTSPGLTPAPALAAANYKVGCSGAAWATVNPQHGTTVLQKCSFPSDPGRKCELPRLLWEAPAPPGLRGPPWGPGSGLPAAFRVDGPSPLLTTGPGRPLSLSALGLVFTRWSQIRMLTVCGLQT